MTTNQAVGIVLVLAYGAYELRRIRKELASIRFILNEWRKRSAPAPFDGD